MPIAVMLGIKAMSIIMLSTVTLSVVKLSIVMLVIIVLSIIMLSLHRNVKCSYAEYRYAGHNCAEYYHAELTS